MKIQFGSFPQSIATPEALANMSPSPNKAGNYSSGDDFYVRLITRPYQKNYTFSDGTPIRDNEIKYFKIQPLYWDVLADFGDCLLLVSDQILYGSCFYGSFKDRMIGHKTIYRNDWGDSDARKWLNEFFYRKAFPGTIKREILDQKTDVDACGFYHNLFSKQIITRSNVIFLSFEDACNPDFGFKGFKEKDEKRQKTPTDFAKASGAFYYTGEGEGKGFGSWWLLSNGKTGANVLTVMKNGTIDMEGGIFNHTHHGYVPCILIIKPQEAKPEEVKTEETPDADAVVEPEHHVDDELESLLSEPDTLHDEAHEMIGASEEDVIIENTEDSAVEETSADEVEESVEESDGGEKKEDLSIEDVALDEVDDILQGVPDLEFDSKPEDGE